MIAFVMDVMAFVVNWVSGLLIENEDDRQIFVYQEMASACKQCIYESHELDDFRDQLLDVCEKKLTQCHTWV